MSDTEQIKKLVADPYWRMNNLYWVQNKEGKVVRFRFNFAQEELYHSMHNRNEVLKARQLGISTFVALLMLDRCLFTHHFNAGIVDKSVDEAKKKLGKALFAYDCLDYVPPEASERDRALAAIGGEIKRQAVLSKRSVTSVEWKNGSVINVGATMRGGTLQMLHVSELAYVANHNPVRAKEIRTGALQAVSKECCVFKESTHEGGRAGINYEMVVQAMNNSGHKLSPLDYKFFFFAWHQNPEYELDADYWDVLPDEPSPGWLKERQEQEEYFAGLEAQGIELTSRKKAWYATQRRTLGYAVKQEFPSNPEEAFETMAEHAIYAHQITRLKLDGRLNVEYEADAMLPTFTSWDIGMGDSTSIFLWQAGADGIWRVLDHYAASDMPLSHYVGIVRAWEGKYGVSIARHFLPHDAQKRDWEGCSFAERLRRTGLCVSVVPRTPDIWAGIQATRQLLPHCLFHARVGDPIQCQGKEYPSGLQALENYQTAPDGNNGVQKSAPLHDRYSHSADAFRMFAEAVAANIVPLHGNNTPQAPIRAIGAEWMS